MKYVGIDPSLTSTGIAVLEDGVAPRLYLAPSKPLGSTIIDRRDRLAKIATRVLEVVGATDGDAFVTIEAPTYGAAMHQGSQHDRAGLWWILANLCENLSWPLTEVSPTTLKAFTTGKGNAGKPEMMARTAQEFPGVVFQSDDDSDALWLATMGRSHADPDTAPVPQHAYRVKALKAVGWEW